MVEAWSGAPFLLLLEDSVVIVGALVMDSDSLAQVWQTPVHQCGRPPANRCAWVWRTPVVPVCMGVADLFAPGVHPVADPR